MPSTPNPIRAALLTAILVFAAALGSPRNSEAQVASSSPDVLSALLVEVRGLRSAMEQMASAGPRVQLALGRLQLQEQRVNTLARRLEDARTSLAQARTGLEDLTLRMNEHERLSRESSDPEVRQAAEAELKQLKRTVARGSLDLQRLQSEEATLSQDISVEQGRWSELNDRLEELERALTRR
jgi:predicted  nucleic acid-binding Zn-ribbon protein